MKREEQAYSSIGLQQLGMVADQICSLIRNCPVCLFFGEMGSGKTTLIKEVCHKLGVIDSMSSPTFGIVNEYETQSASKVYHFDFYRIKSEVEAYDIGTEEYFYSGYPCFVEWPEKIPTLAPEKHVEVQITIDNETQRTIAISIHD